MDTPTDIPPDGATHKIFRLEIVATMKRVSGRLNGANIDQGLAVPSLEFRAFKVNGDTVPILSHQAVSIDPITTHLVLESIKRTKFKYLKLNIQSDGNQIRQFAFPLIELCLMKDGLQTIEVPSDQTTPDWIFDLLRQENVVRNSTFRSLKVASFMALNEIPNLHGAIDKALFDGTGLPGSVRASVDRCVCTMSMRLAKNISCILKDTKGINKLMFFWTKIDDNAVLECLADGIRSCRNLREFSLYRMYIHNDADQRILAEAISSNPSVETGAFQGVWGDGTDNLQFVERLDPRIGLRYMSAYEDPRVFSVLEKLLRNQQRYIKELRVFLWDEQKSQREFDPSHIDGFLDSLGEYRSRRLITHLCFCGHFRFTKEQLKKLWDILIQMKCEFFAFRPLHPSMPHGWEQDFVAVLPALKIRELHVQPKCSFVNAQLVLDALQKNCTVEKFRMTGGAENDEEIKLICALNWAGRRIEQLGPNDFNVALWPKVLERVNDRKCKILNPIKTKVRKTDILFHLLTGNVQKILENKQPRGNANRNRKRKSPPE